ncbi:MAG: RNAase P [Thermoprotei archaeon]|nr:RNAase P [Thermoplasmata archaeon]RLF07688.1 MAG: RNAase P [Thermoprotei archaeon]
MRRRGIRKPIWVVITRRRMSYLLKEAREAVREGREDLARSYVKKAIRLGEKMNVRFRRGEKWYLCKKCLLPLVPGVNARVRFYGNTLHITCLTCGSTRRVPLGRRVA